MAKSLAGLRLVCAHEAWHAIYMHPQRRGSRNPKLWNIAVDYIVNNAVMEDLKVRKKDAKEIFTKNLGLYMTLEQLVQQIKNPYAPIKGFEAFDPSSATAGSEPEVALPSPDEDRELTPAEKKALEAREKKVRYFYADPDLADDMKSPEKIYDYLFNLLPKCPKCGRLGVYPAPNKNKGKQQAGGNQPDKQQGKDKQDKQDQQGQGQGDQQSDQHDHGDGQPCNCPNHQGQGQQPGQGQGNQPGQGQGQGNQPGQGQPGGNCCDGCGGGIDIFGLGGTLDDHMDTDEDEEKLAKRVADAMEAAKRMAGYVPGALEDELGKLTAPKVTWQDFVRTRLLRARAGNGRNDWTRFRSRPMFCGMLNPKRRNYFASFCCLLDTSGSMSRDDMAFGLSQLQSMDENSEGTIVPADATIYWDDATKIRKADMEEISKVKVIGRGGTKYAEFFTDYEKNVGKCDFLIVITDGFLLDSDIAEMQNPGIDVIWLITSGAQFNAPFGRVFDLKSR
jgi:predicted metal-dependent peptidase